MVKSGEGLCRNKPVQPESIGWYRFTSNSLATSTLREVIKRLHYPLEVMLACVRWYTAYPLSLRNLEEMMAERGVVVDHATVHRWALKMMPVLAAVFRKGQLDCPQGKALSAADKFYPLAF